MITVSVYDTKCRLSEILALVQRGFDVQITKYGRPIARLIPEKQKLERKSNGDQRTPKPAR
jgi:prevent-host-death family protein